MEHSKIEHLENLFISYEDSLILKLLGFDEYCLAWYCNDMNVLWSNMYFGNQIQSVVSFIKPLQLSVYAPMYSQAFDFLIPLAERKMQISGFDNVILQNHGYDKYVLVFSKHLELEVLASGKLECLKKLIEIVLDNKK